MDSSLKLSQSDKHTHLANSPSNHPQQSQSQQASQQVQQANHPADNSQTQQSSSSQAPPHFPYEQKPQQLTPDEEAYTQANNVLTKIVRFEFLAEQIINYLSRSNKSFFTQQRFLEILSLLELVKIYYKFQKFKHKQVYLSEDNPQVEEDAQSKLRSGAFERFFSEDYTTKYRELSIEQLRKAVGESLERIKSHSHSALSFNNDYTEELLRSKKRVNVLSKLPIPSQLASFQEHNTSILLGEQLFMIRPFIYSLCLRIFGVNSYTPYFVSLVIDSLRLILQRNVKFYQPAHKEEFKQRNKEMILNYLLRNPFYARVFRNKVLVPMLDSMFGNRLKFLKGFILGIIEMRCSICLLL